MKGITGGKARVMVNEWNRLGDNGEGVPCTYWPVRKDGGAFEGEPLHTHTRSGAWVDAAGQPVVMVRGKAGYVSLAHVVARAE